MSNYVFDAGQRNAVRALIRSQAGFEAFRLANGEFASRDMTAAITLKAIEHFGLQQEVEAILARAPEPETAKPATPPATPATAMLSQEGGDALAATVLDPLRPFLAPTLLDTVSTALNPIIALALKPAVEVERVRTITLDADGTPVAVDVPASAPASIVGNTTMGKLYGLAGRGSKFAAAVAVDMWDSADAPRIDPMYVPEPATLAKFITAAERGSNVWLSGPASSGKSTMPEQYAARTYRPYCRIAFQRAIEPVDLIGMLGLDGKGGMKWRDGVLTRAIRTPGCVIVLEELTFAPAGLLAILQTLLDMRFLTLPTGERVDVAEGVVFVAADNTRGYGDDTGMYHGTTQANAALVDRFQRMLIIDYLPVELETQALHNHTLAPKAACERVVRFVNGARRLSGFENRPLGLRRMVAFVDMVHADKFPVAEAFHDTCLSRLPDAEREALRMHFAANFDNAAFEAELSNAPAPAPASTASEQVAARNAFDPVE